MQPHPVALLAAGMVSATLQGIGALLGVVGIDDQRFGQLARRRR